MFNKKIAMEQIVPTSKVALKLSCLEACRQDINKAKELYAYMSSDLKDLPDFDPIPVSGFDRVKSEVQGLMGWLDKNQDRVIQGIDMIRSIKNGTPRTVAPVDVPPIPADV